MTVATTSQQAYQSIKEKLGIKQTIVYEAIKTLGRATNEQIADHLGWEQFKVTGRTNELCKFNMIEVDGLGRTKSGRSAKVWVAKDINDDKLLEMDCE